VLIGGTAYAGEIKKIHLHGAQFCCPAGRASDALLAT